MLNSGCRKTAKVGTANWPRAKRTWPSGKTPSGTQINAIIGEIWLCAFTIAILFKVQIQEKLLVLSAKLLHEGKMYTTKYQRTLSYTSVLWTIFS